MKIEKVKISKLNPAEYNPRRMTNKQYEDLKNSLEKFGLVDPIIINSDNTVVGGHQRLRIMRELGAEFVPTVRVNLSNFDMDDLLGWCFKHIELGFNIDKIEEDKPTTVTVKEKDIKLANKLYEDLKAQGYKVTIK